MKRYTFSISKANYDLLHKHLFPGDGDEHGAVILAGICETANEVRFLAREVILAREGQDFVPGRQGYRALTANFVAHLSNRAANEKLCYFTVHNHGGSDSVSFSQTDLDSHARGYPALLDITNGGPIGALVFAKNAVAGQIWTRDGIKQLDQMKVIGKNLKRLFPKPPKIAGINAAIYNRQSLFFGSVGQARLARSKVVIIGAGGVGSIVSEHIARLGVGHIVAIDYDKIEDSNVSRVMGSRLWECFSWLQASRLPLLKKLGIWLATYKVDIAKRVAKQANSNVKFEAIRGSICSKEVVEKCLDADFIFLCADSMQSRLVFNALVHQYLIPGIQIGSKVPIDTRSGSVENVFAVARPVLPEASGGCLLCNELISFAKLQDEALTEKQRRQQAYVADPLVKAPSVVTLNALGSAQAVNYFLFNHLGLFNETLAKPGYRMNLVRENSWTTVACKQNPDCLHCGSGNRSIYGRGDRASLPCPN
ncbi:MAG: ThiF family adenylyltransferase [Luteolibacter sp.]